jgi:hypothetical protein
MFRTILIGGFNFDPPFLSLIVSGLLAVQQGAIATKKTPELNINGIKCIEFGGVLWLIYMMFLFTVEWLSLDQSACGISFLSRSISSMILSKTS